MAATEGTGPRPFDELYPLTIDDVGVQLGVGPETVRRYVRTGQLDAVRRGSPRNGELRFAQAYVDSYLERRRVG